MTAPGAVLPPASLRDVYPDAVLRSFVTKLRQYGATRPGTCEEILRALDHLMGALLQSATTDDPRITDNMRVLRKLHNLKRPDLTRALEHVIEACALATMGGA